MYIGAGMTKEVQESGPMRAETKLIGLEYLVAQGRRMRMLAGFIAREFIVRIMSGLHDTEGGARLAG